MTALGALLTAAYVPGWTGAAVLTGWIVLSCLLPFYLLPRIKMGLGHWLGLIFLLYATTSILWAPIWQQSIWDLWLTWILAFSFCLGAAQVDLRRLWIGMALGLLVCESVAWAQWLGYDPVFANNYGVYAGTYVNPDMFGETACLLTIALIASRCYWPLVITLPPIYLTQARTVYVAYAAVIAFAIWERWRWAAIVPGLLVVLSAGYYVSSTHKDSIAERLAIWQDTLDGQSWFGRGAGSFFMLYPAFASRTDTMATRPEDPHNEYLNLAFQYGLGALPVLALLALGLTCPIQQRYILVAFLAIGFFSFPIRIPTEGFIGMVALGRLCRDRDWAWAIVRGRRSIRVIREVYRSLTNRAVESLHPHKARI